MPKRLTELDESSLSRVVAFLDACRQHDGASAAVQLDHGLNSDQEAFSWFLCYQGNELAGLCSVFAPSRAESELSICVRPDLRRKGLGSALFVDAVDHLRSRGVVRFLLVCDRSSSPGQTFAKARSEGLDHSEYSLRLAAAPAAAVAPPPTMAAARTAGVRLAIRKADAADAETISSICADAFQEDIETARGFIVHSLAVPHRRLYLGALPGSGASGPAVCCCALAFEGKDVSINTVAVARAYQGQGYAKEFLSRILAAEVPKGGDITIDVDSTNERAFGLYRSLGFVESRTVDYYLACPFP